MGRGGQDRSASGESHEGMRKIVFRRGWDYRTIEVPGDVERASKQMPGSIYDVDPNYHPLSTAAASC